MNNPYNPTTWSYQFYKEGYDNHLEENPYYENEFAFDIWNDGKKERLNEEN